MSADGRMFHGGVPGMSHAGRSLFARGDDAVKERSMAPPPAGRRSRHRECHERGECGDSPRWKRTTDRPGAKSHVDIHRCRRIRVEVLRPRLAPRSMRPRKVAQMSINLVAAGYVEPGPPRVPFSGPREEMRE